MKLVKNITKITVPALLLLSSLTTKVMADPFIRFEETYPVVGMTSVRAVYDPVSRKYKPVEFDTKKPGWVVVADDFPQYQAVKHDSAAANANPTQTPAIMPATIKDIWAEPGRANSGGSFTVTRPLNSGSVSGGCMRGTCRATNSGCRLVQSPGPAILNCPATGPCPNQTSGISKSCPQPSWNNSPGPVKASNPNPQPANNTVRCAPAGASTMPAQSHSVGRIQIRQQARR